MKEHIPIFLFIHCKDVMTSDQVKKHATYLLSELIEKMNNTQHVWNARRLFSKSLYRLYNSSKGFLFETLLDFRIFGFLCQDWVYVLFEVLISVHMDMQNMCDNKLSMLQFLYGHI